MYIYTRWEMVTWRDSLEHRTHTASRRHVWEIIIIIFLFFCFFTKFDVKDGACHWLHNSLFGDFERVIDVVGPTKTEMDDVEWVESTLELYLKFDEVSWSVLCGCGES